MIEIVTGIDDISTGTDKSKGWSFISFSKSFLAEFNELAHDILVDSKLRSFHGKNFKRGKVKYYKGFLSLIRNTLENDNNAFMCCTLLDEDWRHDFQIFCSKLISDAFGNSSVDDGAIIEASKAFAEPMFTYLRISSQEICADKTSIDIDSDNLLNILNNNSLIVNGNEISSKLPIFASINAYQKKMFPKAPSLERDSIRVLNDEDSFLIQAADIMGNYSTALVRQSLGKSSKTNDLKCKIFSGVFGDILDTTKIKGMVDIDGDDLVLKESGSFTFSIG